LPILRKLIAAYKLWQEYLPHFPTISKYTLGEKIDGLFIELAELIFIARYANKKTKISYLKKSSLKINLLKFFLQVSWEIRALDNKKYIALSKNINEISNMIGGWIKKETPAPAGE